MSTNQFRQTKPSGSSATIWRTSATGQQDDHQCTSGCFHQNDKASLSRRSIDWRDSGIVIDDNHLFQSFESIGVPYDSRASITSSNETTFTQTRGLNESLALSQDEDGDTILHLAVVGFTLARVKDLIGSCDLNSINDMMQTPLHVATLAERLDMVKLLIEQGAKLDVYDRRGNTPLHLACQKGFVDIASAILDALQQDATKANAPSRIVRSIESCNFDGFTCLHLAAMNNQNKIIELLATKYQADMGTRDSKSGETILHKAIRYLNVDLVKFLLDHKLHNLTSMTDFSARNPLDMVEISQQSTSMSAERNSKLCLIRQLIEDCIRDCGSQGGCCLGRSERGRGQLDLSDSASSSSDYCDSD